MPALVTRPGPTIAQVSGELPSGEPGLAVLARRTYTVDRTGRCAPADEQSPLVLHPEQDPALPLLLAADIDLHPCKPRTDVVVLGHAHGRQRARRLEVVVRVGAHTRRIAVLGERTCSLGPGRKILFSEPGVIERVPLTHAMAYGGRDRAAEARHGNPLLAAPTLPDAFTGVDLDAASPWIYPRNPAGRGYLVEPTAEAVDALALPQLEDPDDLLTPERLVAGSIDRWHRMPLPQATGWVDYSWYPRIAFLGVVPIVDFFPDPPLEVERGLVPALLADGTGKTSPDFRFELTCGASPGLQLPHLRGGEPVELHGVHPQRPRWSFAVPPAPSIATDGRNGRFNETRPVLHTLLLEPDLDRVTVVWRGSAPALRTYAPQELATMPLRLQWRDE